MLINANALSIPLADKSVHLVITSPPYYGLRDYGTAKWEGGDPECDHLGKAVRMRAGFNERYFGRESGENNKQDALREPMGQVCSICGAVRIDNQIGLEQTPEEYVNNLVAVFKEVRRVLVDDGIVYLNLGDSYASIGKVGQTDDVTQWKKGILENGKRSRGRGCGNRIKSKDLIGIPWMVAFALRADGWYLRDDIIWAKGYSGSMRGGAVMPESTKDRCTKAYEHVFMLTKKPKYYYDYYATLEPALYDGRKDTKFKGSVKDYENVMPGNKPQSFAKNGHERWQYKNLQYNGQQPNTMHLKRLQGEEYQSPVGNPRNVWLINTKPFKGAHYAVFPPELVRLPILAGTSEKGHCPKCGARWERVITKGGKRITEAMINAGCDKDGNYNGTSQKDYESNKAQDASETKKRILKSMSAVYNYQWQPTCNCGLEPVPDIVLDPFCGSGTTLMVAKEMGRQAIGLDLSFQYLDTIAKPRLGILLGG